MTLICNQQEITLFQLKFMFLIMSSMKQYIDLKFNQKENATF